MEVDENQESTDAGVFSRTSPDIKAETPVGGDRFRLLFENSLDAMVLADEEGRLLDVNQPACDLFGYLREQMLRMTVADLLTPQIPGAAERYRHDLQTDRATGEVTFVRTDGQVCAASYSAYRVAPGQNLSIFRDITEYRRAERILRETEAQLRLVTDAAPVVITYVDAQERFRFVNRAYADWFGAPLERIVGKPLREVLCPEAYSAIAGHVRTALSGQTVTYERTITGKGSAVRHLYTTYVPDVNPQGEVLGFVGVVTDIDDLKRAHAEIEELNARLRRSIAETHHRVKNNLQIISALAELQIEEGADTVPATALRRMGQHTRALAAVHDLLVQGVKAESYTDRLSTRAALDKLVPLLQDTSGGRNIQCQTDDFLVPVREGASLTLLVSELVSNAIKHGAGDILLSLRREGETVQLEVTDHGPGFPADFDPQTRASTGLSLIDATGRYDLHGEVAYGNVPEGGGYVRVTFPMPQLPQTGGHIFSLPQERRPS